MGILDRFKTKKGEEKVSMPAKATESEKATEGGKETKTAKKTTKKVAKKIPADLQGIVVKPVVTEKAAHQASVGQYAFAVASTATRTQVGEAITALYGIVPERVNIQVVRGKVVRFGRSGGKRKNWKKAIITLPKGKTIDIHEGV